MNKYKQIQEQNMKSNFASYYKAAEQILKRSEEILKSIK